MRIGNWLTIDQGQTLLHAFERITLRGNEITLCWQYCSAVGFAVPNSKQSQSRTSSAERSTGYLRI